jgi:hypothetical protein
MKKQFLVYVFALTLCVSASAQSNSPDGNFTASGNATNATPSLTLNTMVSGTATPRLSILAAPGTTAGFVGIGTPAPSDLLHVNGNIRANQFNSVSGILNTIGTANLSFRINNTARMTILGATSGSRLAGFVGLNTTTPDDWFHVNGNIRANQFNSVSGVLNTTSGSTNMSFNINGTTRMLLQATTGALGIGITPVAGERLHVNGSTRATQFNTTNGTINTIGAADLSFRTNNTARMTILGLNGYVGIANNNPANQLQIGPNPIGWVGNDFVAANGNGGLAIYTSATDTYLWGSADISIRPGNTGIPSIYAKSDGTVGIGTMLTSNPNSYKLAVNGKIGAKDVQVEVVSTTWPDYVFDNSYNLPSLTDVAQYIHQNKHLIDVPSAEQVEKEGHSLGEMDKILLKKIEELTLYVIQQQKEIEELRKKVEGKK